jgi:acyl-CoA synthetase (AMP-forming)/AMP-acid ligase II
LARPAKGLVSILCRNDSPPLAAILGSLAAGHAVALLDPGAPEAVLRRLQANFSPDFLIFPADTDTAAFEGSRSQRDGLNIVAREADDRAAPHPEVSLLLSTSGTTGSSKFVRLSGANLTSNADQISRALQIAEGDIAAAHLPIHYSYGLSVVTSHLRSGAAVHLTSDSITDPALWRALRRSGATHLPGVPFHYGFVARANFATLLPPTLRTLTQAGGALAPRLQMRIHEAAEACGSRFFVMYGQTEAGPRMTTLSHERLLEKIGSVGPALEGGSLEVVDDEGLPLEQGAIGHVVYEGPNVMLGYAESRDELAAGDVMGGRLETGDLGRLDEDGYLFLTGRTKRFAKIHGLRIALDEVEARFGEAGDVAAIDGGDKVLLFTPDPGRVASLVAAVAGDYHLMTADFRVRAVPAIPRKPSGKIDYAAIKNQQ